MPKSVRPCEDGRHLTTHGTVTADSPQQPRRFTVLRHRPNAPRSSSSSAGAHIPSNITSDVDARDCG
jgi:hypothetical protein